MPVSAPPPWKGIPSIDNYIQMYQIGDMAIFGYSAAHGSGLNPLTDHNLVDPYVEKFCKWVGETDSINSFMVVGHWSGYKSGTVIISDLGCELNMASPGIFNNAQKHAGCAGKTGMYWEGHDHQNQVLPNSYVDTKDPLPVGFDISAAGMNGGVAGFAIWETVPEKKTYRVDYYVMSDEAKWKTFTDCWEANPGAAVAKCRHLAQSWRDIPVSAEEQAEKEELVRRLAADDLPKCTGPAPAPGPGPGPGPGPSPGPSNTGAMSPGVIAAIAGGAVVVIGVAVALYCRSKNTGVAVAERDQLSLSQQNPVAAQ